MEALLSEMTPEEIEKVGDALTIRKAFDLLLKQASKRYRFKRHMLAKRMRLVDGGAGFAIFAQANGLCRIHVSLERNEAWLEQKLWTPELRKEYQRGIESVDVEDGLDAALCEKVRDTSWFKRKFPQLQAEYLARTRRGDDGSWTLCDATAMAADMLSRDLVVFEEHEFRKACGGGPSQWAHALNQCLEYEMQRLQRETFRRHERFGQGLALAEDVLGSKDAVVVALSLVRLESWAEEMDRGAFAYGASSKDLALALAKQLLET